MTASKSLDQSTIFQALQTTVTNLAATVASLTTSSITEGSKLFFTNARAIAAPLTGLTTTAGSISTSDTIVGAIGKIIGNIAELTTSAISEGSNLYFTAARVLATPISGFSASAGTVSATDTLIVALNKLSGNLDALVSTVSGLSTSSIAEGSGLYFTTGRVQSTTIAGFSAAAGTVGVGDTIVQAFSKIVGNLAALSTTVASLTTTSISEGTNLYFTNARAIAAPLTGLNTTAGTVSSSDTILGAIGKLVGNVAAASPLTAVLTGLSTSTKAAITASDSILGAFGKVQAQITSLTPIWGNINATSPVNDTKSILQNSPIAGTILSLKGVKLTSGSLTLSFQINGTPITGLNNLSITTTAQDFTATAANTFAVGDKVEMVISAASGPPSKLVGTLWGTR